MTRVTEKKKVRINRDCVDNPVYLRWFGLSGGKNHWLFGVRQVHTDRVTAGDVIKRFIEDLENAETQEDFLTKHSAESIRCGASNLDGNDIEGLRALKTSPKVQLLTNPLTWSTEGAKWLTVLVQPGRFTIKDTRFDKSDVEITFNMPSLNIQVQ